MRISNLSPRLLLAAVLLATVVAHISSIRFHFYLDDWAHLTIITKPGFDPWAFRDWFYRPLFLIAFGGMFKAFGTNPVPWHVVELALHLANVYLIYRLASKLRMGPVGAAAGALAFGVYPLLPDAVGWLCAISGLMAAFCGLVSANIALETRIHPVMRGILCAAIWTCGVFSKEEAACLILVIPFLPLAARIKQSRKEWIGWGLACLLFLVGLWLIVHCEQQCSQHLGNPDAKITVRILSKSVGFVGWMSSVTNFAATSSPLSAAMLALIPVGLWMRYRVLRPGLLWFCGGGYALGIAMGNLGPSGRYTYVPTIGLALCLAALVDRLALDKRPLSMPARLALAFFVCCVAGNIMGLYALPLCLVIFLMRNDPSERKSPENGALIALLAAGIVFRSMERTLSLIVQYQPTTAVVVVIAISLTILAAVWLKISGRAVPNWPEMALCSLVTFSTYVPGILELAVAVLIIEGLMHASPLLTSIKQRFDVNQRWVMRFGAAVVAGAVIGPWFFETLITNSITMDSALQTERAVNTTAAIARRLPRGSEIEVIDEAGITGPEPAIWVVTTGMIAKRPDLRTTSRVIAPVKPGEIPERTSKSSYGIFLAKNGNMEVMPPKNAKALLAD